MTPSHEARLIIAPGHWVEHDPFLLLAEDWFEPGTFAPHPHRGFETVTLVLEGELTHRDNHGGRGTLRAGDAQWMTAGRGIVHAEEPVPGSRVHSLQLWLNLPAAKKRVVPRYLDLLGRDMPVRREANAEIRVYAGRSGDAEAPTATLTPVTMVDIRITGGGTVAQELPSAHNAFLYVLEGGAMVGTAAEPVAAGELVWLTRSNAHDRSRVVMRADAGFRAVLWAGEPIGEPVAARGPFVMNTEAELEEAFADFRARRF
jgi:redox-sensitive bicupin YhaK (pirin superfamily)